MRVLILLLLGVVVAVFLTAAHMLPSAPEIARVAIIASIVAMLCLYFFSQKHRRRVEAERNTFARVQFRTLVEEITEKGIPLAISGSPGLGRALLVLGFGVGLLALCISQSHYLSAAVLGGVFTFFGVLCVNDAFHALGKPVVVLAAEGITTPWSGYIAWEQVYGVSLEERKHRNVVVARELFLRIKDDQLRQSGSVRERLLRFTRGLSRGHLRISLNGTSEAPETV